MKFNQTKNLLLFTPSSSLPAQEKEGNGMSCLPSPKTSQPSDQGRMDILHLNLATWSIFFLLPPVHGSSGHSSYHRNQSAALQHTEQMSHPEQQEWQCGEGVDAGGGRGGGGGKAASHIQNEMFPPEGVSHSSSKVQSCRIFFFFPAALNAHLQTRMHKSPSFAGCRGNGTAKDEEQEGGSLTPSLPQSLTARPVFLWKQGAE